LTGFVFFFILIYFELRDTENQQKGPVGYFTEANTVVVANSSIIVSNAVPSTQPASAPSLINNVPLFPWI